MPSLLNLADNINWGGQMKGYTEIINALEMIWSDQPRLDIRACRDEAFNLLDPVVENFLDFSWAALSEQLTDLFAEFNEEALDDIEATVVDAASYGLDLYLATILAENGRLTATGLKPARTEKLLKVIEQEELQSAILERYDLIPLIIQDYALDCLADLAEDVPDFSDQQWSQVNALRQGITAVATTTFLITAIHLENLYPLDPPQKAR